MVEKRNQLNHLAIIMDGNGRWATQQGKKRIMGHREGMYNVERITLAANELGIRVLSLYAFSTENWARPKEEVAYLMNLPVRFFDKFMPTLMENNVKVNIMGYLDELPSKTYDVVQQAMAETADNTGLILNFAFNYGSRREILTAMQELGSLIEMGQLSSAQIDEKMIAQHLMTANFGKFQEPDLLIRTSGEQRISNFMLWQLAYSELAFSSKNWPDFNKNDLQEFVSDFENRHRRFGKLDE
ncbi:MULTISPECIES: isoprenyl transferase [unclassified Lactobacillus]|uniref:isoprenyl transferase n=1 Tax=unclassified Lactobacillus TaxID=2620435 RepID=UPI000EFB1D59|nr:MULTISPECIES: isoprenyl transferase [unclassified Lactobacillus]RMC39473.1 isoprenyl transferase [Lactobacillus sp. ESL0237]RMC43537.1 isoprenyl transferase [Lactobacillus sp. ESL0234]RMC45019.1 isoprenyl transferase [Lactobacillus sp. ESL0236]RMC46621.1 isoprenyl transferase [Lactobacillus sp. ESL0230]RMC50896.1 isoprenyl transferase [Lactobacillus sp. ESL0225]